MILSKINLSLFKAINSYAGVNPLIDHIAILIAQYMPILFIAYLLYLWFKDNKSYRNYVLFSSYAAIIGLLINFIISLIYFHPRPFVLHLGKDLIIHNSDTSFPSDHTTFMLSIAIMLMYFKKTYKIGIVLTVFGIIGGMARVFCGIHFPFDIIGSLLVSIVASFIIYMLKNKLLYLNKLIIQFIF